MNNLIDEDKCELCGRSSLQSCEDCEEKYKEMSELVGFESTSPYIDPVLDTFGRLWYKFEGKWKPYPLSRERRNG